MARRSEQHGNKKPRKQVSQQRWRMHCYEDIKRGMMSESRLETYKKNFGRIRKKVVTFLT